ncbi:NUDIX hydrolase [Carnobacterium gallinarum]|uniref:NUDIX hydrolase n=1 Tax=Carnobacterium gallinarum TaxID=2749 RepID=UPI00054D118E|nr:8-oxo-dGTP diphosphatase [Carnobacterium gallinarum]
MRMYTLCFLKRNDEILLLNRQKNPWMGRWNGVGGKIEIGETPLECAVREIYEETEIKLADNDIFYGGQMTWFEDGKLTGGLELYGAELDFDFIYTVPQATREGILDFKKIDWIFTTGNKGMPDNIPFILNELLKKDEKQRFICYFEAGIFQSIEKAPW